MANFPSQRLLQADATLDEVSQLRAEFTNSDLSVQDGIEDLFKGLSSGGIREYLATLRRDGHFAAQESQNASDALPSADFSPWDGEVAPGTSRDDSEPEIAESHDEADSDPKV